jgi:TonB family protein
MPLARTGPVRVARWPVGGEAGGWFGWRRGEAVVASAVLHLFVLLAILLSPPRPPRVPEVAEPGTVEVLMLPAGVPQATSKASPATPAEATPREQPATAPAATVLPAPPAAPAAASPAAPAVPEARTAPPAPPPAPSPPPPPAEVAAGPLALPLPPVPAPPRPKVAMAAPSLGSLAELDAALHPLPSRLHAAVVPRRGVDLRLGPEARANTGAVPVNPRSAEGMVRIEGADLGAAWVRELHAWWRRHGSYPPWAVAAGEDGTNEVKLLVDRSGRVLHAELEMSSGSKWLDLGTMATFRDATLPPFPPSTPQNEAILHLTITYILIRARGG